MRAWERVTYREKCGNCGALLVAGTPMQTISRHGLKRKLIRCPLCADGDAPPDLPLNPVFLTVTEKVDQLRSKQPMQHLMAGMPERTRGAAVKAAQAMDEPREWMPYRDNREPGEDD